jgi:hypothetical protein
MLIIFGITIGVLLALLGLDLIIQRRNREWFDLECALLAEEDRWLMERMDEGLWSGGQLFRRFRALPPRWKVLLTIWKPVAAFLPNKPLEAYYPEVRGKK